MKTGKKLFAVLLAFVMVLALSAPAFAAVTTTGSITITNPVAGTTYKVYRIFDLDSYRAPAEGDETDKGAYLYKVNSLWTNFINSEGIQETYVNVDETTGYVTWIENASAAEFAQKALEYATGENTKIDAADTKTADDPLTAGSTVEFTGLALGYYLVDSSLGALCALTTTDPTAEVTEKNEKPTVDKEITNEEQPGVGDTVNYQVKITVQAGAENYVLKDKMSAGLTFDASSIKIQVGGADVAETNYTKDAIATSDYTFKIAFKNDYVANLDAGTEIIITYSATINSNAVKEGGDAKNTATLEYGSDPDTTHSTTDDVEPTLVPLTINKVDGASKKGEGEDATYSTYLGGAKFILSRTVDGTIQYATVEDGVLTGWVESEEDATKLTTSSEESTKGQVTVAGLAPGTYSLTETKAPDGYNKLDAPTPVNITVTPGENGGAATVSGNDVTVENNAGAVLPSTGGIGTTVFYVIGGVLVVAAIVLLVTRKRMNQE